MSTLALAVVWFGDIITTALFLRAIMSWFARSGGTVYNIYNMLCRLTDPIVEPCRRFMNAHFNTGMFDFSIFVTMIFVEVVTRVLSRVLFLLA